MKVHTMTPALAIVIYVIQSGTSAQFQSTQLNPRLPTIDEAQRNAPPAMQLENYRLGAYKLQCSLPDGTLVEVTPVSDWSDFSFHAIRSQKGPLILANERAMGQSDIPYKIFSFYRECAVHALTKVKSKGPGHKDDYSLHLIKAAECLAVIPTQRTIGSLSRLSLVYIQSRLVDEYGRASSTRSELERCYSADYVRNMIGQFSRSSSQ
jgi:hypothetical protein